MTKRQRKKHYSPTCNGLIPTDERRKQNGGVSSEIINRDKNGKPLTKRYKSVWDCPLDVYLDRSVIDVSEHAAGYKFRHAYFRAVLGIRVSDIGSGNQGDKEMAVITPIYSERLLSEAYEALTPEQKTIVISVCGHDECAGKTAKLQTLHRGLERLRHLWKISEVAHTTQT